MHRAMPRSGGVAIATAEALGAAGVEGDDLDLGAAEVDADAVLHGEGSAR